MTHHLMLIEDNSSDVELMCTAFEEEGIPIRFSVFADGDEAIAGIARLQGDLPDLVLLDLNLPRISGHEVLTALRATPAYKSVPVVVFSTSNHPADRSRCLAEGADDYQVKPPRFTDLLLIVRMLATRWLGAKP